MSFSSQIQKLSDTQSIEPITASQLVELSVVAPSGTENIADDMKAFAEQLKPYPLESNWNQYKW